MCYFPIFQAVIECHCIPYHLLILTLDSYFSHDVDFYSFVTREDDFMFSLFVDTIVLSTFYAYDNGIAKEEGFEMPLIAIFGPDMLWALRDAILFSGNYVELFRQHFGQNTPPGRNGLNKDSAHPQFLPRPGISYHFNTL